MNGNQKETLKILLQISKRVYTQEPDNIVVMVGYRSLQKSDIMVNSNPEYVTYYAQGLVELLPDFAESLMVEIAERLEQKELER